MDIKEIQGIQEKIRQRIEDADLVLVGIGSELETDREEKKETYQESKKQIIKESLAEVEIDYKEFYKRCLSMYQKMQGKKSNQALQMLADMLRNKNHFVISTNVDECLYLSGFRYIVSPCGRESLFQCSENCSNLSWENSAYLQELFSGKDGDIILSEIAEGGTEEFLKEKWNMLLPKCPKCGKPADFNRIHLNRRNLYCEHYLPEWKLYMKWLSGTLNKKLLLLELGTDFSYPQLIRWPFERTALLNKKSFLIRVHENLSNVPEELKGRAEAIAINSRTVFCSFDK